MHPGGAQTEATRPGLHEQRFARGLAAAISGERIYRRILA